MHARHRYESLGLGSGAVNPPAEPTRYTIDPTAGTVTTTRLVAGYSLDFPVVPPHLACQPARFCYLSGRKMSDAPVGTYQPGATYQLTQCAAPQHSTIMHGLPTPCSALQPSCRARCPPAERR
jgi:hypothetical protein